MDMPQTDCLQMSEADLVILYLLPLPAKLVCPQTVSSLSLMRKSVLLSKSWLSITRCGICNADSVQVLPSHMSSSC